MIAYLKGTVEIKTNNSIVIDVNGVGYRVFMTQKALQEIEMNSNVKIYTYMRVMEDDVSLYGFQTNEELNMFELLISVGGIGAKSAIAILSNIEPTKFALAVISNDINTLKKLPGIGAKTAGRIVLELKDKIKSEQAVADNVEVKQVVVELDENARDAKEALQVLGYNGEQIEKVLATIDTKSMSIEDIIKEGLKRL